MSGTGGAGARRPRPHISDSNEKTQGHTATHCPLTLMISSTFFFLFSQLGVGMMLTLLFISPRSIGNSFFKFASLTAAILLGVVLGFNFLFPSPDRTSQVPVVLLAVSAVLT